MIGLIITTVLVLLFVYDWHEKTKIPSKFPTGPLGLPLLGYVPFFKNVFLDVIEDLHVKYGGVFSVNLGPKKRLVVIGDYEILKDVFGNDELTYRAPSAHHWIFRHGDKENPQDARGLIFR